MSVYRPKDCRSYRFDFEWRGQRYRGSTGLTRRQDAQLFESRLKLQLRQEAAAIGVIPTSRQPQREEA